MSRLLLTFVVLCASACMVCADDKEKAKSKAKAAFAFAEAESNAKPVPVVSALSLDKAKVKAVKDNLPLVLWVGYGDCDCPQCKGNCQCGVVCKCEGGKCTQCGKTIAESANIVHVKVAEYEGSKARRAVLLMPKGDKVEQVIQWEFTPTADDIRRHTQPVKLPPAAVVVPSGFFINADGQLCQDGV